MVNIFINDKPIEVEANSTILNACETADVFIPRFCYNERLSIAGNCRMCLVEVAKSPKPIAACAMPVMDGMKIYTNTPIVKKAREGVLEFLLVNHPLDCPICDQGGECDLQDQALIYGSDRGRFYEYKRGVEDKNLGPLIKTIMTRCIHCTRCVRFAAEIAGVEILGTTGRGTSTEIGTYVEKTFNSELSGNVVDLCPVGALTSKPYAFTARSWELRSIESIDVLDAIGSNIRIDSRGSDIMRILPRLNEEVNEEWITDKTRFSFDALRRQRLSFPMIRTNSDSSAQFSAVEWPEVLDYINNYFNKNNIQGKDIKGIIGSLADTESILALKLLLNSWGSNNLEARFDNVNIDNVDFRHNYVNDVNIADLENVDLCLLVGVNPRKESPLLNLRLRKNFLRNNLLVASIGTPLDLTYHVQHLGNNIDTLIKILEGKHRFCKYLAQSNKPVIIIGNHILQRLDGSLLLNNLQFLADRYNFGLNILHTAASRTGALDLGIIDNSNEKTKHKVYYLLNADNIDQIPADAFVIYQGHHGDEVAQRANVILPGSAYTEKNATYINLEGRVQHAKSVFLPPLKAREDWKIIKVLADTICVNNYKHNNKARKSLLLLNLSWNDVKTTFNILQKESPLNQIESLNDMRSYFNTCIPFGNKPNRLQTITRFARFTETPKGTVNLTPLSTYIDNFYMTDPISKSSKIMAKCIRYPQSNFKN